MQEVKSDNPIPPNKGIYLLPNLLTTGSLFVGFYAIVAGMHEDFANSAIAIFMAMILDGLDGRVARLTGTESVFGAQYDSLSDMLSFGVAPALVIYQWGLSDLGKFGWLAAFIYVAAGALRLARFNAQKQDLLYFVGLPIPMAAMMVAGFLWVSAQYDFSGKRVGAIVAVLVIAIALSMVSSMRYHSFKKINLKEKVPFIVPLAVVLIYSLIAFDPPKVLLALATLYWLSGPFLWLRARLRQKKR